MVIDSLFICFCEDFKVNDGTPGREFFAPKSLLQFVNESSDNDNVVMQDLAPRSSSH